MLFRSNRCSSERDKILNVSAIEGKFQNSLVLDDLADAHASSLDEGCVGLNFDLLADLSDLEYEIDHGITADLQDYP